MRTLTVLLAVAVIALIIALTMIVTLFLQSQRQLSPVTVLQSQRQLSPVTDAAATLLPTPQPSPTAMPRPTPTATPSPTPRPSPTDTPEPTPTATPSPTPRPSPTATPRPIPTATPTPAIEWATQWTYSADETDRDRITGNRTYSARAASINYRDLLYIRCQNDSLELFVVFGNSAGIAGNLNNEVEVLWRIDDGPSVEDYWGVSTNGGAVFLARDKVDLFARTLTLSIEFLIQAGSQADGGTFFAEFELDGRNDPDHPVRRVLEDCEHSLPEASRYNPWKYYEWKTGVFRSYSSTLYSVDGNQENGGYLRVACHVPNSPTAVGGQAIILIDVRFGDTVDISPNKDGEENVFWNIDDKPLVRENWETDWNSASRRGRGVRPRSGEVEFAKTLVTSSEFWIEATDTEDGEIFSARFMLGGADDPDHPVRQVLRACGHRA